MNRLPALFISHGGGPWPWIPEAKLEYPETVKILAEIGKSYQPSAILMVSAHWEEREFNVATTTNYETEYDYGGFPPHTYTIKYPAKNAQTITNRIVELLAKGSVGFVKNSHKGLDHGAFVPLHLMYPAANIPVAQISIKKNYSPEEHFKIGELLAPLRAENVLIIGSGLSYHNMRGFNSSEGGRVAETFGGWLTSTIEERDFSKRKKELLDWANAPSARLAHPREDHLIPLMVVAGAASFDPGSRFILDNALGVKMESFIFQDTFS